MANDTRRRSKAAPSGGKAAAVPKRKGVATAAVPKRPAKSAAARAKSKPPTRSGTTNTRPATARSQKPPLKTSAQPAKKTVAAAKSKTLVQTANRSAKPAPTKPAVPKPPAKSSPITAPRAASRDALPKVSAGLGNGVHDKQTPFASSRVPPSSKASVKSMAKTARGDLSSITVPESYRPSDGEPFMGAMHRAYFRKKLMRWKEDIIRETMETLQVLHDDTIQHADIADRATHETDRALELRARDRQRKLIAKIDSALQRIEDGSYGYCEESGEPISLRRLDARPIATLSLEAQERHERRERVYRED